LRRFNMLERVKMVRDSILELVVEYREMADYSLHQYSNGGASAVQPCSDRDVYDFLTKLLQGEPVAQLVISDIEWHTSGNCVGDELYPVTLSATKLPDGRYFLELDTIKGSEEFILSM
jgi:hypothetical protein